MVSKICDGCLAVLAVIGAGLGWFVGGFDGSIIALLIMMLVDIVLGVMYAFLTKTLSKKKAFRGGLKKVAIFTLVGVCSILDRYVLNTGDTLKVCFTFYSVGVEGLSIIGHAEDLGIPIPAKIKEALEKLKEENETTTTTTLSDTADTVVDEVTEVVEEDTTTDTTATDDSTAAQ